MRENTLRTWKISLIVLFLIFVFLVLVYFSISKKFRLIACSVGQGDAILALHGTTQILIDGGPDDRVLNCLEKYMPFWDRTIELVILTHPQKDHYFGLLDVLSIYKTPLIMTNGYISGNESYQVLESMVGGRGKTSLVGVSGMKMRVGMIHLDILNPGKHKNGETDEGNNNCIVSVITYKDFNAVMTCDIEPPQIDIISNYWSGYFNSIKPIEYIKIPHHGSKNGLTREFLELISPKEAVISVGANSFGHPSPETLDILKELSIPARTTKDMGDVVIEVD